ncbi:MAG: ATP-binding protein [Elusimicrobiota bacterium]
MTPERKDPILAEITAALSHRFGIPSVIADLAGDAVRVLASQGLDAGLPPPVRDALGEALRTPDNEPSKPFCIGSGGKGAAGPFVAGTRLRRASRPPRGPSALCLIDSRPRSPDSARLRVLAVFADAVAERLGAGPSDPEAGPAIEPVTGMFTLSFLQRLCRVELESSRAACLILFKPEGIAEIRGSRGEAVALRLTAQLADRLRTRTLPSDIVGRVDSDTVGVLLPGAPPSAAEAMALKLHEHLRRSFRFAVSVGAASGAEQAGLFGAAEKALRQAQSGGGDRGGIVADGKLLTAPASAPPEAPQAAPAPKAAAPSLPVRYQRLVLLNRIALGIFSGKNLGESLGRAGHGILALSGAKYLSILRRDESGELATVHAQGDKRFESEEASAALQSAVERILSEKRPGWTPPPPAGWYGIPILDRSTGRVDGAMVVGTLAEEPPASDAQVLLGDVAVLLHSAFRAERQLREQKTLAAVTEQSADPILLTDLEGRITAWSRGAEETFQFSAAEVLGRRPADFFVPEDQAELLARTHQEALEKGRVRGVEMLRLRKDGRVVPVEVTFTVVKDDAGRPFGMVRVLRDITKRKEIERMKDEFVALVTHDLRIPMTSIRGFSDTMLAYWDELSDDEKKKYLGIILRESKRLGRLVNDFLDLTRFESGQVTIRREPTDLKAVAERVIGTLKGYGPEVRFELAIEDGLPEVMADQEQIERMLINLGGNAIKYSPPQGTVRISARRQGDEVLVAVSDEGPGIPAEAQKHLFEKFYRVADAVTKRTTGTGLGLTVCKHIIEAHGGAIRVESELGKGTTLLFTLPIRPPEKSKK